MKDCLPRLAVLLKSNDEAVLKDGCWGLMYMCRLSIDAVVRSGACEPLTKLLMHSSDDVCCVALEALSAIFSNGSTAHKTQIAHYNVFPRLRYLLHSKRERTREITCSTLANVVRTFSSARIAARPPAAITMLHRSALPVPCCGRCRPSLFRACGDHRLQIVQWPVV